ncbi:serine-rich adhesin for platelets-like [Macrobrachium rosenbergii]|uniref:serine-rich adhesin for platelets-like n=1 Tax=Macrobrachium rosenbergii TaxID=79674 RepID=UPI0034D4BDDA
MDWFQALFTALLINTIAGISLKCGEDIVIHRGEKKVLRFWSSEDELLNVDVLSKAKNDTDTETRPLRHEQVAGGAVTGTTGAVSNTGHAGPSYSSGSISSSVEGADESNKFRTDIETSDADDGISEQNSGNELYYSLNPNATNQQDVVKISESHQEVTSAPIFDQTDKPTQKINKQSNEEFTDSTPVTEISTLKTDMEEKSDHDKSDGSPEIVDNAHNSDDRLPTFTELIPSNIYESDIKNKVTENENDDKEQVENHTTFPEDNQESGTEDSTTSAPDIKGYLEIDTEPSVFPLHRNESNDTQDDTLQVSPQTSKVNNHNISSHAQNDSDKPHFDSFDNDENKVVYTTTTDPLTEQRQEQGNLGNVLPEILDNIPTRNDTNQAHGNIPTKTVSMPSDTHKKGGENKVTNKEQTESIPINTYKTDGIKDIKNKESEQNFTTFSENNQKSDNRDSGTPILDTISDLESVTSPNVLSLHRDESHATQEDKLPGSPQSPGDNNSHKYHHVEGHTQSDLNSPHHDSVYNDDVGELTTLGPRTKLRQPQEKVKHKVMPHQMQNQQQNEQQETTEPVLSPNTEIPDLLTTSKFFTSVPHEKPVSDTLFLDPEATEATTVFYRKIFEDKLLQTTESHIEYTKAVEESMVTTTGIPIEEGLTQKTNHSSLSDLDSPSEMSTVFPVNTDANDLDAPSLTNKNIPQSEDEHDDMTTQKDIFSQYSTDRPIPTTESVSRVHDEKLQKDPENIILTTVLRNSTDRPNEATEYGTEIIGTTNQKPKKPTENNLKIKIGDPLVSENILHRMDELGILNEDTTTYNINEDSYNDESLIVTTESTYHTTDITTTAVNDKTKDTTKPAPPSDEAHENEESVTESKTQVLVTEKNSIHYDDNLPKVAIKENEPVAGTINKNSLTSGISSENDGKNDNSFQETTAKSSLNITQNNESTTTKNSDDEVTEAIVKANKEEDKIQNENSKLHDNVKANKEEDKIQNENSKLHDNKDELQHTGKTSAGQNTKKNQAESDTDTVPSTTSSYLFGNNSYISLTTEKIIQSSESDIDTIIPTTISYLFGNNSYINLTSDKSTAISGNNKVHALKNEVINPITIINKNSNTESDNDGSKHDSSYSLQDSDKSVTEDESTISSYVTTDKPKTTTELDIFASIIERWTEVLEGMSDDTYVSDDDLAINVSEFLDVKSESPIESTEESYEKPSAELSPEHTDPLLPAKSDSINDNDATGITEKDFAGQFLIPNSQSMAGFMDISPTHKPEVSFTIQDTSIPFTEPNYEIQTSTEKAEITTDSQNEQVGGLMTSEQSNEPKDILVTTEKSYQPTTESGATMISTVIPDQVEIATMLIANDQMPVLISPISEKSPHILSTMASSNEDPVKADNHEIKPSTTFSLRDELEEISDEENVADGLRTGKPVEELTTTSPLEIITEREMERNGTTTAFTIPLLVLKNQTMLDNLLNGQVKNGGSKVVIKEQGSKVAISSPSQNDALHPHAFTHESKSDAFATTSHSTTINEYDQTTTDFPAKETTDTELRENSQIPTEEIREMNEKNSSTFVTTSKTLLQTTLNKIHEQNIGYTTDYPTTVDDISIISSALNEYLNIENLLSRNSNSSSGLYDNTFYPDVEESYNNNEDVIKNSATTNIPDISTEESTESFFNELVHTKANTAIPYSLAPTSISLSSTNVVNLEDKSTNSKVDFMHSTASLDESTISSVNNQESQNLPSTEHQKVDNLTGNYRPTTIQSDTEETPNTSNFATIIIPASIVNGLHGGHIKNDHIHPKTEASVTEVNIVDPTTEASVTEITEMDPMTEAAVTTATRLLQNGSISNPQHSGGISRKEDEGQTDYGSSSPFFIRLPGSPDPVPVYIQYEPVEINYVPTNGAELDIGYRDSLKNDDELEITNLFRDNIDLANSVREYENSSAETDSGSYESFLNISQNGEQLANETDYFAVNTTISSERKNGTQTVYSETVEPSHSNVLSENIYHITQNTTPNIDNQHDEHLVSDENEDSDYFKPNKPILKRPDPFFVMEAPKLGNDDEDKVENPHQPQGNNSYSKVKINQNEDRYSVDVSSQYGFASTANKERQPGTVEDVPLGINKEILYPGDYYLHDSYTDVNLKLLRNPVFSLRPKVNTPSPEDLLSPQYTPFPITTNPPRHKLTASPITALPLVTSITSSSANPENSISTEEPAVTSQRHPPSIEYSPIPAVDFDDTYALSYNPDYAFGNEESIIAPYVNQFKGNFGNQEGMDKQFLEKKGQIDSGNPYLSDPYIAQNTEVHASQNISPDNSEGNPVPTDNLPIPSDQFMAHKQVWAFPQSREDPAYLRSDTYNPEKTSGTEYLAFHSPLDFPGIDPEYFSSRKVPAPTSSHNTDASPGKYDDQVILDLNREWSRPTYEDDVAGPDDEVLEEALPADQDYFQLPPSTRQGNGTSPETQHDIVFGPQFFTYLNSLPYALLRKFLDPTTPGEGERLKRSAPAEGEQIFCEWNIRTEPGLYLLMTFHNLSAAYTVDCHGAYIEVERENNGYDARWCGNRVGQAGTRPHVIFAKTEVRITVYDDGRGNKVMPTGFEADIEVIDLFNKSDYRAFMRSNAYPHIRRLLLG